MDDPEVIAAFLDEGAGAVFGPSLHVEGGTLKLDGWWSVAYRVTPRTVILRDEQAPTESTALADVAAALTAKGLTAVGADTPAIALLTYTNLDLGYAPWVLWSTDLATGEADLNAKATEETFFEGASPTSPPPCRALRLRPGPGRPPACRHPVPRRPDRRGEGRVATALRESVGDCRFESRAFGEIEPGDCGSLLPTLVLVDATGPAGSAFVVGLGAGHSASGPVVAITTGGEMRAGVDATVDANDSPDTWVHLIQDLMR